MKRASLEVLYLLRVLLWRYTFEVWGDLGLLLILYFQPKGELDPDLDDRTPLFTYRWGSVRTLFLRGFYGKGGEKVGISCWAM